MHARTYVKHARAHAQIYIPKPLLKNGNQRAIFSRAIWNTTAPNQNINFSLILDFI